MHDDIIGCDVHVSTVDNVGFIIITLLVFMSTDESIADNELASFS